MVFGIVWSKKISALSLINVTILNSIFFDFGEVFVKRCVQNTFCLFGLKFNNVLLSVIYISTLISILLRLRQWMQLYIRYIPSSCSAEAIWSWISVVWFGNSNMPWWYPRRRGEGACSKYKWLSWVELAPWISKNPCVHIICYW